MGEAMLFPGEAGGDGQVQLGPLSITPRQTVAPGAVKVAVRPEAWRIHRGERPHGAVVAGKLLKAAYLGSFFEYTFETALGNIFVVSPDLSHALEPGAQVGLSLADHGVSVVRAA
jgi:iron(III) transport system ATP-binding protein